MAFNIKENHPISSASLAVAIGKAFQDRINQKDYAGVSCLIAADAYIWTAVGKKTKDELLERLFWSRVAPIWDDDSTRPGMKNTECITTGQQHFGVLQFHVRLTMEVNKQGKIHKIVVDRRPMEAKQ